MGVDGVLESAADIDNIGVENEHKEVAIVSDGALIMPPFDFPVIAVEPNYIVKGKSAAGSLEQVLLTLAFAMKERRRVTSGGYLVKFRSTELEYILGRKRSSGSFYSDIKKAAREMIGRHLGVEDPQRKKFVFLNLVPVARFEDGELSIYINGALPENLLFNLSGSFTEIPVLPVLELRNKRYALRLYEFLLQVCYGQNGVETDEGIVYSVSVGICESRFMLGNADIEAPEVKSYIGTIRRPEEEDYEKAYELWEGSIYNEKKPVKKKQYKNPNDYIRYVIDDAINTINSNEKAGIKVTREANVKVGKNHKTKFLIFHVTKLYNFREIINNSRKMIRDAAAASNESIYCDKNGQYSFAPSFEFRNDGLTDAERGVNILFDYFWPYRFVNGVELSQDAVRGELRGILRLTDNDVERVFEKYRLMQNQVDIKNKFSWISWAILNDFDGETTAEKRGEAKKEVEDAEYYDVDDVSDDDIDEVIKNNEELMNFDDEFDDNWEFRMNPNGNIVYKGIELDFDEARENCPLSKSMIKKLTSKYRLEATDNKYRFDYDFLERIGGKYDEIESYPEVVKNVAKNINDVSKGLDSLVEYAIKKVEENGYKFSGKREDAGTDKFFVISVNREIIEAIDWAFDNCITL